MSRHDVYANGRLYVLARKCDTCIFRKGNLMGLNRGRRKEMVEQSIENESCIPCHCTIYGQIDQPAICRGFYDLYAHRIWPLRLAQTMGIITELEPPCHAN